MAGFIVIDRKIQDWRWWGIPHAMALWLFILVNANWKDGYFMGELIPRGSFATSLPRLSECTGMDISTIRKWLKRFEEDGQIEQKVTNRFRVIKVLNYSTYQDVPDEGGSRLDSSQSSSQSSSQRPPNRTNITIEQSNNINNSSGRMKRPTLDEVREYIVEKNYDVDPERFYDYYESNGWKVGKNPMKDWKACIRSTWAKGKKKTTQVRIETPDWYKRQQSQGFAEEQASDDLLKQFEEMKEGFKS